MTRLTVDLPSELEKQLREEAGRQGVSVAEFVRMALTEVARLAAIDAGTGALAHVPGTVDDFLSEKHAEMEAEKRRDEREHKRTAEKNGGIESRGVATGSLA